MAGIAFDTGNKASICYFQAKQVRRRGSCAPPLRASEARSAVSRASGSVIRISAAIAGPSRRTSDEVISELPVRLLPVTTGCQGKNLKIFSTLQTRRPTRGWRGCLSLASEPRRQPSGEDRSLAVAARNGNRGGALAIAARKCDITVDFIPSHSARGDGAREKQLFQQCYPPAGPKATQTLKESKSLESDSRYPITDMLARVPRVFNLWTEGFIRFMLMAMV